MNPDPEASGSVLLLLLFILIAVGYGVWCCIRILSRAGQRPLWAFLMVVPILNLVLVWIFAYARWPRLDERAPIPPEENRYMPPLREPPLAAPDGENGNSRQLR
ncbi:MAG: hypothetical protein AB7P52_18815 [Alphaproteobacteria bacterium]